MPGHRRIRCFYICLLLSGALLLAACAGGSGAGDESVAPEVAPEIEIAVLSSRPDMVSGGDALIEIKAPAAKSLTDLTVYANGNNVTGQFELLGSGHFRGLVSGLVEGDNQLQAVMTASEDAPTQLLLTNYPITGPIVSGPHLSPYECRTEESGLGPATDANCSAPREVEYFYRSVNINEEGVEEFDFKPWPGEAPTDLVTTTTIDNKAVPYIVRVESGVINRTIYRIAILDSGPGDEAEWSPGEAWNKRLAVSFAGGSGTNYNQGTSQATRALNDTFLSRGFAFIVSTELVNRQHSNAILQGETLMMLKEYFVERYGEPLWTVGNGGSGGAIQQLLITQLFPGLLDGIRPSLAYPDSTLHTADCGSLQHYWAKDEAGVWTDEKKEAVSGFSGGTCGSWERSFVPTLRAANVAGCGLNDESLVYHPETNPQGARCTIQEMRKNFYGTHPNTGYARKPQDNVGLQYGLAALNSGAISVEEFLDLNENIGGNNLDGDFVDERSIGDSIAIRATYHYGFLNSGAGGLGNVPILHYRRYTDLIGDIHDRQRDLSIRARLEKALGRSDHQVIWVGPYRERGETPELDLGALSLDVMTQWLDNIISDPAPLTIDKIVKHKPADAVDACWSEGYGEKIVESMSFDGDTRCNQLYPMHSEPRLVAGAPLANDIMKCQLKPIDPADYTVELSSEQQQRLQAIFPEGVCDFTKPGVEQVSLGIGWPQHWGQP